MTQGGRWLYRYLGERTAAMGLRLIERPDGAVDVSAGGHSAKGLSVEEALAFCDGWEMRDVARRPVHAPAHGEGSKAP